MSVRLSESVIAVVLFALLVPVAVLPWIHWQYRRFGRLRGWTAFVAAAGALYGCGVVAFTLFPLPTVTADFCTGRRLSSYWQLTPFASLDDIAGAGWSLTGPEFLQVALNVVLFLPLGFLLRYRFGRGFWVSTVVGLLVSLLVEVTQGTAVFGLYPCPYRLADVDDLMTNTAGAALGWVLAWAFDRALPSALPARVPDLDPPGLARRGLAFAADLLTFTLAQFSCLAVLALTGHATGRSGLTDIALNRWFGAAFGLLVVVVCTLVVPLCRSDRATPGQLVFFLALSDARTGGQVAGEAVVRRFLGWWLPVFLLISWDDAGWVWPVALVVGIAARLRADRRSVLGLLSGTRTVTRAALRHTGTDRVAV
ncbi:VanZ family protein [Actinosynnema sp. NPDC020468]|uniref:VanZ family protein n=1 Tax=Actinosynnema sp. NPDC020468 TaxID=3154488 RepID=UPI0033E6F2EF